MQTAGRNSLCDYLERGEKQGAWPSPYFDPTWYRDQHGLDPEQSPLQHYFARRLSGLVSPISSFEVVKYCRKYPKVLSGGQDPFESYCKTRAQPARKGRKKTKALS
jgi:hypothetical protein